jgi:hypothetical protein
MAGALVFVVIIIVMVWMPWLTVVLVLEVIVAGVVDPLKTHDDVIKLSDSQTKQFNLLLICS